MFHIKRKSVTIVLHKESMLNDSVVPNKQVVWNKGVGWKKI